MVLTPQEMFFEYVYARDVEGMERAVSMGADMRLPHFILPSP